jgi:gas vesicle protein
MSSSSDKVLCFLLGASVGSIVALLYAPKSGRETREDISRRANESREFVSKKIGEGREFVEESGRRVSTEVTSIVDKGRKVVDRQKEQVTAAFDAGKEAYRHEQDSSD